MSKSEYFFDDEMLGNEATDEDGEAFEVILNKYMPHNIKAIYGRGRNDDLEDDEEEAHNRAWEKALDTYAKVLIQKANAMRKDHRR